MISTWCMNCDGVEPGNRRWISLVFPAATVTDNRDHVEQQMALRLEQFYGPFAAMALHVEPADLNGVLYTADYQRVTAVKVY